MIQIRHGPAELIAMRETGDSAGGASSERQGESAKREGRSSGHMAAAIPDRVGSLLGEAVEGTPRP